MASSRNQRPSDDRLKRIARDYVNINNSNKNPKERIQSLFQSMYRVRCNLFHGTKNPDIERDYRLVESSAEILEICLPALYAKTFNRSEKDLLL